MNAKIAMAALVGLLLLASPVAADDDAHEPSDQTDCSAIDVLTYDPYIVLRPRCLPWPLGEG